MARKKLAGKATAERILEAADELLGELGYDGVSVRDIAQRAGVNKALVFYHFGSKEELFERVLDGYYAAHHEALERAYLEQGELRERFHQMIDVYLDFIIANDRYPRLIQRLVTGNEERAQYIQKQLSPMLEWTRKVLGELCPERGPLAARHFFVTFSGMTINYFTYAPVLGAMWGSDPLAEDSVAERRAHLHWVLDALLGRLESAG